MMAKIFTLVSFRELKDFISLNGAITFESFIQDKINDGVISI